ncbi:MAG: MgtC/SapB family protein [Syntrophomonadaceae bacterium]|jgi:putative Mg2+ transporter-C (MgtC) family protein
MFEYFWARLLVAVAVGTIIGLKTKALAARTFTIICTGTTLLTIVSTEYYKVINYPWFGDPGRLSAQIVAALGFIGSGLIWISNKNEVRGLAAAASLWLTAILGILIGSGLDIVNLIVIILIVSAYFLWSK